MKKNLIRLLSWVMALALVMSLAACGGDSGSSSESGSDSSSSQVSSEESSSEESSSESSESSAEDSSAAADGKYATIQEFLDDPTVKSQLDAMIEQLTGEDDTMSVSVTGEGDKLVYLFTFSEEAMAGTDIDTMASALEGAMEGQESVFENIAGSVASVVDVANPVVVVTYAASDGTTIFSKEFTAAE